MTRHTEIAIDGIKFLINGRETYPDAAPSVRGLLFNSRMIQAIFDDENARTRELWRYPDTGIWDPDRNTNDFCANLELYRKHGVLGVTVGLQGGGSVYTPWAYDTYINSAFTPAGDFKQPYFDRLSRILQRADELGMIVIVNYFYWKQVQKIPDDNVIRDVTARVTEWLLRTGHRNILVDVANESVSFWKRPCMEPERIHELIEIAQSVSVNGRHLLISVSTGGDDEISRGKWREIEDFSLPHGNGCTPQQLKAKLLRLKDSLEHKRRPRPIMINEDGIDLANLEAAVEVGCSWGYYSQGYGSDYPGWREHAREKEFEELSGYQTLPVNWGINTAQKMAFFARVKQLTEVSK